MAYVYIKETEKSRVVSYVVEENIQRRKFSYLQLLTELKENNYNDLRNYLRMDSRTCQI